MSRHAENEPECHRPGGAVIQLVIQSRPRDIGGFTVRRTLPSPLRRLVGPFIFFDHMGPVTFAQGQGIDVRPHPHTALATITYLFEGEFVHRDSLGSTQAIRPGDVNWMVAGRGIVHSERTPPEARARGGPVHGLQTWVALPLKDEDIPARFEHHPSSTMPVVELPGAHVRIVAGNAYGQRAPTGILSPTLYAHVRLAAGSTFPIDDTHEERAVYVVDGAVECDGERFESGSMVVLEPRARAAVSAHIPANLMLVGGAPIDGARHIYWNFVASSKERIERAKAEWRAGRFPKVPGDEVEFIPLPDDS
jgi:redox-sensitive bicupin YhaK (pirin superfamily)